MPEFAAAGTVLSSVPLTASALCLADLVIVTTDHMVIDYEFVVQHAQHVLDTRNATKGVAACAGRIVKL